MCARPRKVLLIVKGSLEGRGLRQAKYGKQFGDSHENGRAPLVKQAQPATVVRQTTSCKLGPPFNER